MVAILPLLDGARDRRCAPSFDDVLIGVARHQRRGSRGSGPPLEHAADAHAGHERHLDHDIGAHLAGSGKADVYRPVPFGTFAQLRQ